MKYMFRWVALLVAAFSLSVSLTSAAPTAQLSGVAAHALVLQTDSVSGVTTLAQHRIVNQTAPLISMDGGRFAALVANYTHPARSATLQDSEAVIVQLLDDATNAVVYQTVLNIPTVTRGEFHFDIENPTRLGFNGSNIVDVRVPLPRRTFPVRLPVIAGASQVSIQSLSGTRAVTILNLNAGSGVNTRASDLDPIHDIAPTVSTIAGYVDGPVDNRVDVLIMGDGYTQSQENKFKSDAKIFADGMFAIAPYKTYKSFFNVRAVYGPSKQSGADRPPYNPACNDFDSSDGTDCCRDNNPSWTAQTRSTRYNSTFCWGQTARLMVAGDSVKVFADADAAYADWDEIWIITNDTTYGGSGGELAAASIHPLGVQIQQHEVGHSLLRLSDEYGGSSTSISCDDKDVDTMNDCRPNVTNATTRATLKWNYWVSANTPIPTTSPLSDAAGAGLWKGALYTDTKAYRGCFDCIMRTLGRPFGKVAGEQLPMVLYNGGWEGAFADYLPAEGVSMIDSYTPTNDSTWNIAAGGSLNFSAVVVGPTGKKIQATWYLNGTPVKTEKLNSNTSATFTLTPLEALDDAILQLQVMDIHATLHPSNRPVSVSNVMWTIDAAGAPSQPVELMPNGGFEDAAPSGENRALGWTPKNIKGARKCDDGLAYAGNCYYQLQGMSGKVGTLKLVVPVGLSAFADESDLLVFSGHFKTTNLTGTFEAVATLVWSDSTKTKVILPALTNTTAEYVLAEMLYQIPFGEARTVTSFDVTLRFKTAGGKLLVDNVSLLNYLDFLSAR